MLLRVCCRVLRVSTALERGVVPLVRVATLHRSWLVFAAALAAIPGAMGCASFVAIRSGEAVDLGPEQGIFVVHISSNVPVERMTFGIRGSIGGFPGGEHIVLFVADEGSYQWPI